jgi:hypothetical protein
MPGNPLNDPKWAADLADVVERVVGTIRDKTARPVVTITRGIVFGLLAAILGVVALVLVLVGATRGLQVLLDLGLSRSRAVYVSYLVIGGILGIAGLFLLKKRSID